MNKCAYKVGDIVTIYIPDDYKDAVKPGSAVDTFKGYLFVVTLADWEYREKNGVVLKEPCYELKALDPEVEKITTSSGYYYANWHYEERFVKLVNQYEVTNDELMEVFA